MTNWLDSMLHRGSGPALRHRDGAPSPEDLETQSHNAGLLQTILRILLAAGVSFPIVLHLVDPRSRLVLDALFASVVVLAVGLMILMRRGHVRLASLLLSLVLWIVFTIPIFVFEGLHDAAITGYFFVIILASLLLTGRVVLVITLLSSIVFLIAFYGENSGLLRANVDYPSEPVSLIMLILCLSISALLLRVAVRRTMGAYERARHNERALLAANRALEARQAELAARTQALEASTTELVARRADTERANRELTEALHVNRRRADLLEASAQVSRAVSEIRNLDELLLQVTQLISQHFGYYHVAIFLIDETGRNAVLRAACGQGGQRSSSYHQQLRVGSQGIVGYVTATGQPRIAVDVSVDNVFLNDPNLPETRSEMTLPLRTGDEIIGALDVQSATEGAFRAEDVNLLSILADQVAVAIQNARLFQQTQVALNEVQETQRRYLRQEWDSFLGKRRLGSSG